MIEAYKDRWQKSVATIGWILAAATCAALARLLWTMVAGIEHIGLQEDAMIGLRHLRHFVEGNGLYYNVEHNVVAVTSPVFWLLSSLSVFLHRVAGVEATLLEMHSMFSFALAGLTLSLVPIALGRQGYVIGLAVFALLFSLLLWPLRFNILGLEGFMLLFSLIAMQLAMRHFALLPGCFLVGVLASVRPEFSIIVVVSALYFLVVRTRGQMRLKLAVALGAGSLIQPFILLLTTGHMVPHSVVGKATFGQRAHLPFFDALADRLTYLDGFIGLGHGVALLLALATLVIGARAAISHLARPRFERDFRGVVQAVASGYTCFIFLSPALWEWYASFWLLLAIYAISVAVAEAVSGEWSVAVGHAVAPSAGMLLLLCVGAFSTTKNVAAEEHNRAVTAWLAEERLFRGRLGRDLAERWNAESVWMEAVGWQGYFNRVRVIDEVGLASTEVVAVVDRFGCDYFVEGLKLHSPQFIIKRRFEIENNRMMTPPVACPGAPLFQDESARRWFDQHYEQVDAYDSRSPEYFGPYSHLLLFRRIPNEK